MACNCGHLTPCNNCSSGQSCGCPQDCTNITPAPSVCGCCPNGYTYRPPSANYPNGICIGVNASNTTAPIPCVNCEDSIATDCVYYSGDIPIVCNAYGISIGDSLTTIINKMCIANKSVLEAILSGFGLDTDLGSAFCQLVANCPSGGGSTTPILGSIIVTFP